MRCHQHHPHHNHHHNHDHHHHFHHHHHHHRRDHSKSGFNHLISWQAPILGDGNLKIDHQDHLSGPALSINIIIIVIIIVVVVIITTINSGWPPLTNWQWDDMVGLGTSRQWLGAQVHRGTVVRGTREPIMNFNCNDSTLDQPSNLSSI